MALRRVLMCKPSHFEVEYAINPWMAHMKPVNRELAFDQWGALKSALECSGVYVSVIDPVAGLPDMVFTCDSGIAFDKKIFMGQFRYEEREGQQSPIKNWLHEAGYSTCIEKIVYEGNGDSMFAGPNKLFGGYGFRSEPEVYAQIGNYFGSEIEVTTVRLIDHRFYHLDTCFMPLNHKTALCFEPAIDSKSLKEIREKMELIPIPEADAMRFACNVVVNGRDVIMPAGSETTMKLLQNNGFNPIPVEVGEFLKAGGACHCLTLELERDLPYEE